MGMDLEMGEKATLGGWGVKVKGEGLGGEELKGGIEDKIVLRMNYLWDNICLKWSHGCNRNDLESKNFYINVPLIVFNNYLYTF